MVEIKQNLVSSSKYNIKCPYEMKPQGITVHNTANDASAKNEIAYMISNNNQVSYHYAIDDIEIIQGIPENRNAWHASDNAYGKGNRTTIAIEICYSKSGGDRFIKAEKNAAEFIAYLLKKYGWGIDKVKRHYDYAPDKKYCPHRTMDMGWDRFLNMVKSYMGEQPQPSEPDYTGVITYQAYTNKWLPEVNKCDNTDDGFAGIGRQPITGLRAKPQYGKIYIKSRTTDGNWLEEVSSDNYSDGSCNSYSGILGKPIDLIKIRSTKGYVSYRVKTLEDGWLEWVDSRTTSGYNSYAGIHNHTVIGIQMK